MKHYLFLFTIATISSLSIFSYEIFNSYDELTRLSKIIIPGIAFSFFVVAYQIRVLGPLKSILVLISLTAGYYINFIIGFSSWGLAVPVAGGLGGALIGYFIMFTHKKKKPSFGKLIVLGITSTLPGFIFFILNKDYVFDGVGFAIIIALWQILVGKEYLKQIGVIDKGAEPAV